MLLQLLGLQHGRLLRAQGRLRRHRQARDAGRRVQDARQGAAQERHRGHPRRGVQPHGRGQRARARRSRFRGIDNKTYYMLTPEGYYFNFSGTRQHAQLQQPDRAQHGARLPALLGGRVPHRRLPLRSGGHSRARPERRAAAEPAAARSAGLRSDPRQVQADCRGVGRRRPVPGRLVPRLRPLGGVERQVPRRGAQVPQGRHGPGRRDGPARSGLAGPLRGGRGASGHRSISSPATTASRCATWSPTTTSTTRPTARTTATAPTTTTAGTAAGKARPTIRRSTRCGSGR